MINKFEDGLLQECLAINDGDSSNNETLLASHFYNPNETYTTNTCGSKNQQQVSLKTGLLKVKHHLYTQSGSKLPFNLLLCYNQEFASMEHVLSEQTPLLAKGWKFNYQQSVKIVGDYAYYCDGEFNVHKLTKTGDKYFDKYNKTGLVLTVNTSDGNVIGYQLTNEQNTTLNFDICGNLIEIISSKGSTSVSTNISYDSSFRISQITDGLGKVYTFTYTDTSVTVKDQANAVICSLTKAGMLLTRVQPYNSVSGYSFIYSNDIVCSITDELTRTKACITTDSNNKVSEIKSYDLVDSIVNEDIVTTEEFTSFINISYGNQRVIVTSKANDNPDEEGTSAYYYFATNGELIYVSDKQETQLEDNTEDNTFENAKDFKSSDIYANLKEQNGITTSQAEYEVTSLNTGETTHTQALGETSQTWYQTKYATFDIKYTVGNNTDVLTSVKFTLADYTQTMLSKFKNPNNFNLWCNDCKNLITGCSNMLTIRPHTITNDMFATIESIKYAMLTLTDKTQSYSYISNVTSSQLTLSEYLDILNEYRVQTTVYNNLLQLVSETDYQGIKTTYTYDSYGDCTKIETNNATNPAIATKLVQNMTYTDGRLLSESGYNKLLRPSVSYTYGINDSLKSVTDANGNVTNYTYFEDGKALYSVSSGGYYHEMFYEHGRIKRLYTAGPGQDLSQKRYTFNYNDKKELESVRPGNIPEDNQTLLKAPKLSKPQKKFQADGTSLEDIDDTYAIKGYYDNYGRLVKTFKVAKSNLDNLIEPLMYYFYWDDGYCEDLCLDEELMIKENLTDWTSHDPYDIDTTKDAKLRIVLDKTATKDYNSYGILYDGDKVKSIIRYNSELKQTITRDAIDRVVGSQTIIGPTYNLNWQHDAIINSETEFDSYFSNKITEETLEITNTSTSPHNIQTTYAYDGINRLTSISVTSDGINRTTEYSFVPAQNKTLPLLPKPGQSAVIVPQETISTIGTTNLVGSIEERGYGPLTITGVEYDNNGNITLYGRNTYAYDSLNRLVRENNYELDKTIVYKYDATGQLFKRHEYPYTTSSTISSQPTASTVFIGGNWVDQVATVRNLLTNEDKLIKYDNSGRMTVLGGLSFGWNDKGHLVQVSNGDKYTQYDYDNAGNRASKKENDDEIEFKYLNGKLVKISQPNETHIHSYFIFLHNTTGVIGFQYAGNLYTYRKNIFGDVTEIYKGTERVVKYAYDAWGNCTILQNNSEDIANVNPIRYRGYYYDIETGLYYLKSRYYSPELGRFISPDGVEYLEPDNVNGLNLYAYCYNNPIMYADPSGHLAISISLLLAIGGVVGATIGAGASVVGQYLANGYSWENFSWGQLALDTVLGGVSGILSMSPLGLGAMVTANAGLGFVGAVGGHLINGSDFSKVSTWVDIGLSTALGALVGGLGGAGSLNSGYLNRAARTAGFLRAAGMYDDVLTKAATGFYRTSGIAANALRLSHNNLIKHWNKMIISQASKALTNSLTYGSIALLIGTAGKGFLYDWYNDYF